MRKLKGIPLLDSPVKGTSECFSEMARPLYDMPVQTTEVSYYDFYNADLFF